jgi:pimeloyl-ACP methyl ester carboxylesterase
MIETLEPRVLFASAPIDTASISFYLPDGSAPAALDKTRDVWLVIHGLNSSKDDASIQALATAVDAASPNDQVILVDWAKLSDAPANNVVAVNNALAAGDALAAKLRQAGIRASHLNVVGFSMGGMVESRVAKDLHGVNRLIAVDPAAPDIAVDHRGHPIYAATNFARYSKYSIAFYGASYVPGSLSADDTIALTDLPGDQLEKHVESLLTVTTMLRRAAGVEATPAADNVSRLFSIQNILAGNVPAWHKNTYAPGYEALLACNTTPGASPIEFEPMQLTYQDRHGHLVQL